MAKEKFLGKCDILAWNCLKDLTITTLIAIRVFLNLKVIFAVMNTTLAVEKIGPEKRLLWDLNP